MRKTQACVHWFVPKTYEWRREKPLEAPEDASLEKFVNFLNKIESSSNHEVPIFDKTMLRVAKTSDGLQYHILSNMHALQIFELSKKEPCLVPINEIPDPSHYNVDDSLWDSINNEVNQAKLCKTLEDNISHESIICYIQSNIQSINAYNGDNPSIFFSLMVKFIELGTSCQHLSEILEHSSPYVQALAIVIARYVLSPESVEGLFSHYLMKHQSDVDASAHSFLEPKVNILQDSSISIRDLIVKLSGEDEFLEAWFPIYSPIDQDILKTNIQSALDGRHRVQDDHGSPSLPYGFNNARSFFEYIGMLSPTTDVRKSETSQRDGGPAIPKSRSAEGSDTRKKVENSKTDDMDFEELPYL